jgi:uncharacterized protein (DUF1684 family)
MSVTPTVPAHIAPAGRSQDFIAHWYLWHGQREAELAAPYSWLSLTGIHWFTLDPDLIVPSFPGTWHRDGEGVEYVPDPARPVLVDARPAEGPTQVLPYESGAPTKIWAGAVQAELILRGGTFAVRTRDPASAPRAAFRGVPHFPVDPFWDVPAEFESVKAPTDVEVDAVVAGVSHHKAVIGRLHFQLAGEEQTLLVFQTNGAGPSILFRDPTNGDTTYGSGRFLYLRTNDPTAFTHVDFNRAVNPPCAFSQYCTCPLPPPQNTLTVPVTAGETLPGSSAS